MVRWFDIRRSNIELFEPSNIRRFGNPSFNPHGVRALSSAQVLACGFYQPESGFCTAILTFLNVKRRIIWTLILSEVLRKSIQRNVLQLQIILSARGKLLWNIEIPITEEKERICTHLLYRWKPSCCNNAKKALYNEISKETNMHDFQYHQASREDWFICFFMTVCYIVAQGGVMANQNGMNWLTIV